MSEIGAFLFNLNWKLRKKTSKNISIIHLSSERFILETLNGGCKPRCNVLTLKNY